MAELEAILAIATRLNAGLTTEEVLDQIYDGFRALLPYDRLGCAVLGEDGQVRSIWRRSTSERSALGTGYSAPLEGSSLADIVATGRPRTIDDLEQHLLARPRSEATRLIVSEGVRSSLTCPLIANGRPIGFLFFSSFERCTYTATHTAAYQEIAALVSLALEKSLAYDALRDAKERLEAANRQLTQAAYFDALTCVPSRRYFDLLFEREWSRAKRHGEPLSVIMIDVDYFKQYNDTYGHLAGDECLRRVSDALSQGVKRGTDVIARFGGEEFVAVLPATDRAEAFSVAERLRQAIEALRIAHEGSKVAAHVTVSQGVAGGVPREGDGKDLLRTADTALYQAKAGGRNRTVIGGS